MNVFVTGATGLIGSHLVALLQSGGHTITRMVRGSPQSAEERPWDARSSRLNPSTLAGCDVLVHLAGENIGDGRWTTEKKRRIRDSRVQGTRILAEAIREMPQPPAAFITASAIGFYGDRGDEVLTESSPPGEGFLSDVCREWEAAADPARERTRVVHVRTGVVLSREGGALARMLTPFKLGVGGVVGSGKQWWSWISLQDAARLFQFVVDHADISGPINGVSPQPVTNAEFTRVLGKTLGRPTLFPLPAFVAKLALGEMAEALILSSARVQPEVALAHGFACEHPDLASALRAQNL